MHSPPSGECTSYLICVSDSVRCPCRSVSVHNLQRKCSGKQRRRRWVTASQSFDSTERSGELSLPGHDNRPQLQYIQSIIPPSRTVLVLGMSCLTGALAQSGRPQLMMMLRCSHRLHVKRACVRLVCITGITCVQRHALAKPLGDAVSIAVP